MEHLPKYPSRKLSDPDSAAPLLESLRESPGMSKALKRFGGSEFFMQGVAEHFVSPYQGRRTGPCYADPNTLYNPFIKAFERSIVRLNRGT
jgi:hypothetical protein